MLYNAGFIVIVSFSPALLIELRRSIGEAGFVSSLIIWVMIGSIPLGGVLADKLGTVRPMVAAGALITVGCLATAGGMVYLLQGAVSMWMFALIGIVMGIPAGAIMTLPAAVLPVEHRGVGMGIFFTWFYVGMAVFPPIAGAIQDATGGAAMSLAFGAALVAASVPALGGFMLVRRVMMAREIPQAAAGA